MDIPPGWEVQSITYKPHQTMEVDGKFLLESGQIPLNSFQESWELTPPNPEIYASSTPFPLDLLSNTIIQQNSDHQCLMFSLSPVQYFPSQMTLSYSEKIEVTVTIKKTSETVDIHQIMSPSSLPFRALKMVIISNQQLIGKITDSGYNNNFAKYALWKTSKGIQTGTYSLEKISQNYPGDNLQEKILNFIRDAKKVWGIQYVILGVTPTSFPVNPSIPL